MSDFLSVLGAAEEAHELQLAYAKLNTLNRPQLDEDDEYDVYDWVTVKRAGIELGFVDPEYFRGEIQALWRIRPLMCFQLTFYSDSREGISAYRGELPFGLLMSDGPAIARSKLAAHEASRRSYLTDRWDTPEYRIVVAYKLQGGGLDSVQVSLRKPAFARPAVAPTPQSVVDWLGLFGQPASSPVLAHAVAPLNIQERIEEDEDEREVDFRQVCGLALYFEEANRLRLSSLQRVMKTPPATQGLVFGGVKFYRDRDIESVQYPGPLPFGLDFEDTPAELLKKMVHPPAKHSNGPTTGRALWHLEHCSVNVLYSTIENFIFRVMVMAPGYWREIEAVD